MCQACDMRNSDFIKPGSTIKSVLFSLGNLNAIRSVISSNLIQQQTQNQSLQSQEQLQHSNPTYQHI